MKTVGYVRVSGSRQVAEGYGLVTQERRIRAYATSQGWTLAEIIRDEAQSGVASDRPGFLRLRAMVEAGEVERIIIYKLDRLSRSLLDLKAFVDRVLLPSGAALVSVTEQLDTSSSSGKLFVNILGSFAEFERDIITERLKGARESKVLRGCKGAGNVYGYRWEGKGRDRVLVPVPAEHEIIRWIFQSYAAAPDLNALVASAKAAGHKTRKGVPFPRSTLRYMLANAFYVGTVTHSALTVSGVHDPAVSRQVFDRVQRLLTSKRKKRQRSARRKREQPVAGQVPYY